MIYLAGPANQAPKSQFLNLRLRRLALAVLHDAHEAVYDAAAAIVGGRSDAGGTVRVNAAALERCDAVLALLPVGVSTFGTPVEVELALRLAIPVVTVGGVGSVQLGGLGVSAFWATADGAREAVAFLRETLNRHQPSSPSSRGLESSSTSSPSSRGLESSSRGLGL